MFHTKIVGFHKMHQTTIPIQNLEQVKEFSNQLR